MAKNSADLIANIRRRAQLSQDQGQAISDADILAFASDELQNVIGPKIYAMRGWHFAAKKQFTLGTQRYYRIPDRAAGGTIISVEIVNSTPPNRQINLAHPLQTSLQNAQLSGENYYIWANNIVLSTGCPSTGTMIVRYLLAPSAIVANVLEPTSSWGGPSPDRFIGTVVGTGLAASGIYDIYMTTSPYEVIVAGVPGTAVGNGVSFTVNILSTQSVLDQYSVVDGLTIADLTAYANAGTIGVADSGSNYHPQLNDEFHDYLAQRTAMRCMESIGHSEDLKNMSQKLQDLESAFIRAISPRERGDIKVILQEDFVYDRRF